MDTQPFTPGGGAYGDAVAQWGALFRRVPRELLLEMGLLMVRQRRDARIGALEAAQVIADGISDAVS